MRTLPSLRDALHDIVRSLVENRNDVIVTNILAPAKAFEIRVSLADYDLVLSSLHLIKELASGLAGIPEGKDVSIKLLINDRDQPENAGSIKTEDATSSA